MANYEELQAMVEAYVGQVGEIKNIENIMGVIIDKIKQDPYQDFTNSKENKLLENYIQKQFGFNNVYCIWGSSSEFSLKMYTFVGLAQYWDNNKMSFIFDEKNGYYDTAHVNTCYIHLSTGVVKLCDLTAREYTAALIHEIGHNFDKSIYSSLQILFSYIKSVSEILSEKGNAVNGILNIALTTNSGKGIYGMLGKVEYDVVNAIFNKIPAIKYLYNGVVRIGDYMMRFLNSIVTVLSMPLVPLAVLLRPIASLMTINTKKMEEFADSVAVTYGYGADLSSFFIKVRQGLGISKNKKINNGIEKVLYDLLLASTSVLDEISSVDHGSTTTRTKITIQLLKRELQRTDISPDMRRDIEENIRAIEEVYQNYLSSKIKGTELPLTLVTRRFIDRAFNGRTDLIAKLFPNFYYGDGAANKYEKLEYARNSDNMEELKLYIYESCYNGYITNEDKDELISMM